MKAPAAAIADSIARAAWLAWVCLGSTLIRDVAAQDDAQRFQAVAGERPVVVTPEEAGLRLRSVGAGDDRRVVGFDRGEPRVGAPDFPLAAPVRRAELARYESGEIVAMCGGFGEPLTFYLLDPASGRQSRIDTGGGRRLPPSFGDGLGTWPLLVAGPLYLFAWEGEIGVEFQAFAQGGGVRARRDLPLTCVGYRLAFEAALRRYRVTFLDSAAGVLDRVDVLHPLQPWPRLVASVGRDTVRQLDFGSSELGERRRLDVRLENRGKAALPASLQLRGSGFVLVEPEAGEFLLGPGAVMTLGIEFRSPETGETLGRLRVLGPAGLERTGCALRAFVADRPDLPDQPVSVDPAGGGEAVGEPGPGKLAGPLAGPAAGSGTDGAGAVTSDVRIDTPRQVFDPAVLAPPEFDDLRLRWTAAGALEIEGRLRLQSTQLLRHGVALTVRNRTSGVQVTVGMRGAGGGVRAELPARCGEVFDWRWSGAEQASRWRQLAVAPADFRLVGQDLVLRGPPGSRYLLVHGTEGEDGSFQVFETLAGELPADGVLRLVAAAAWFRDAGFGDPGQLAEGALRLVLPDPPNGVRWLRLRTAP